MTQHRSFKRIVRARMAKTGESYTAARSSILAAAGTDEAQAPVMPQSDSTLRDRTGQGWEHWLALLDDWGARERNHTEIARHLREELAVDGWWAQTITLGYERARGRRAVGETAHGFTANATRTVNVPVEELFDAVMDESSRDLWLGHAELEVRTATRPRGARFNRRGDSSRVIVGFEAKGEGKSVVAVSHERLEDSTEAERMKGVWRAALTALKTRLEVWETSPAQGIQRLHRGELGVLRTTRERRTIGGMKTSRLGRRCGAALVPVLAAAAVVPPPAGALADTTTLALAGAGAADPRGCAPAGSRTLAASAYARVFTRGREYYEPVWGCLYGRNRRVRLGVQNCLDAFEVVRPQLAGRFAGYSLLTCNRAPSAASQVVVRDLRDGEVVRRRPALAATADIVHVDDLELHPSGAVAWIATGRDSADPRATVVEVHTSEAAGPDVVLASGTDIDPRSLALSGSTVYWTSGGVARSATLLPAPAARPPGRPLALRSRRGSCEPAGSSTFDASPAARVFSFGLRDGAPLFACLHRRGKRVRIGYRGLCEAVPALESVEEVRLAGRFAAVVFAHCASPTSAGDGLAVFDLARRRRPVVDAYPWGVQVVDLELARSGTLAWIRSPEVGAPPEQRRYTLETRERGASAVTIESGLELAPESLAASGATLYWSEGGSPRSTTWR